MLRPGWSLWPGLYSFREMPRFVVASGVEPGPREFPMSIFLHDLVCEWIGHSERGRPPDFGWLTGTITIAQLASSNDHGTARTEYLAMSLESD